MASALNPWNCPTCRLAVASPFCPGCGERPLGPPDLSLSGLAGQVVKTIAGVDGRLLRSLRLLVCRPGALTAAYIAGRRRPLVGPFQLFFLANFAFFIVQSLTHTKIFSSSLDSHLHRQDWSDAAQRLVTAHLRSTHDTLERFTPLFDHAVLLHAKALIVLMVVPFALLLPLVFLASRRPFAVHMAFALHVYAVLLLLFCVALGVAGADMLRGGEGLNSAVLDNVLTVVNLCVCSLYLYVAIGRIYGGGVVLRVVQAVGLAVVIGAIALGYRFTIFLITLYSIGGPLTRS